MPTLTTNTSTLVRAFNLQNVDMIQPPKNPYSGKVPTGTTKDKPLYYSGLGTPVLSDITFGDRVNAANNQYSKNGKIFTFQPVTLYTVLLTVHQAKKIVETEIDGRDGTVKEYIGMGDYEVTIQGVICGTNGHYPIDEVSALKKVLDAPIPLVVTSWYLQNLDVHNIVVKDYEIGQTEGGYSYQQFTVSAKSDVPLELIISNV